MPKRTKPYLIRASIRTCSPIRTRKILQFDGSGVSEVAFEDTEHFAVTTDFLNNRPRRLEQLLADDQPANPPRP